MHMSAQVVFKWHMVGLDEQLHNWLVRLIIELATFCDMYLESIQASNETIWLCSVCADQKPCHFVVYHHHTLHFYMIACGIEYSGIAYEKLHI